MKNYKIGGSKSPIFKNDNSETLLCFDFDECLSPTDFYKIFLRGSNFINELLRFRIPHMTNNKISETKLKYESEFLETFKKLKSKNRDKYQSYCEKYSLTNNDPLKLKNKVGLTHNNMDDVLDLYNEDAYLDFLEMFIIPNENIINDLELLLKEGFRIIILTNGRCFTFIRNFFYNKFKDYDNAENTRPLLRFIRLFDSANDNHIRICGIGGITNYVNQRCIFSFNSKLEFQSRPIGTNGPWIPNSLHNSLRNTFENENTVNNYHPVDQNFGLVSLEISFDTEDKTEWKKIYNKLDVMNHHLLSHFNCNKTLLFDDSDHYSKSDKLSTYKLIDYNTDKTSKLEDKSVLEIQFKVPHSDFNTSFNSNRLLYNYIKYITNSQKVKIVSGFPGIGKSSINNNSALNLGEYRIRTNKLDRHTYFSLILEAIISGEYNLIFVSAKTETRQFLENNFLKYNLVYPAKNLKEEYLERYKRRNTVPGYSNTQSFVNNMNKKWNVIINDYYQYKSTFCKHIILKKGQFLSNVLDDLR